MPTGVIVCTIEKANAFISHLIESDGLGQLSSVVVDELHMVRDEDRGYLLELLLTKLRYATLSATEAAQAGAAAAAAAAGATPGTAATKGPTAAGAEGAGEAGGDESTPDGQGVHGSGQHKQPPSTPETPSLPSGRSTPAALRSLQLIGMSATLPNAKDVAEWLGAQLYETDYRPVQLAHYLKVGRCVKDAKRNVVRMLGCDDAWERRDPDHVAWLCKETVEVSTWTWTL